MNDEEYLNILLQPIRVCAHYRPKFGQGAKGAGLVLAEFQKLYREDPFYNWFGLDHPLMYAAHKAAGGMTSIYRQIGIGCEQLFRRILKDSLSLSSEDVKWSYEVEMGGEKKRTLSLDGRVRFDAIANKQARKRFQDWMMTAGETVGVEKKILQTLEGVVFEVRQGYKSKDSKRQNADIANATSAYVKGYFPCAVILSGQIDSDIVVRYRLQRWGIVTGIMGANDPLVSTYDFMREIVGYDLARFFTHNSKVLKIELEKVLLALLTPEAK